LKAISAEISNDLYYQLDKTAKQKNLSKKEIIEIALTNYFEKNNIELTKLNIENLVKAAIKNISTDEKFIAEIKKEIIKEFTK
jgi:predicted transcriptional regulator